MGLKKGQASEAFKQGKMEKYNFKNLPKDKMREIAKKGVEKRKENAKLRRNMKEQLEILLSLSVTDKLSKQELTEAGLDGEELNNQMLLMFSLLKKGLTGDVQAIKEIRDMVNGTISEETNKTPIINIVGVNSDYIKIEGNSKVKESDNDDDNEDEWEEEEDEWEEDSDSSEEYDEWSEFEDE